MANLKVAYAKQYRDGACGAAALDMVYRCYGKPSVDQKALFEKLSPIVKKKDNFDGIYLGSLLVEAREAGFFADAVKFSIVTEDQLKRIFDYWVGERKIPLLRDKDLKRRTPQTTSA
jgi:hypothetical protein